MYPVIVEVGPFTVYSFGLMLGIALLLASWLLTKEFDRKKLSATDATTITFFAVIFGIAGSKLFYLFEAWDEFLADPIGTAFSPGGLTFYGGLILSIIAIMLYTRSKKIPFLVVADAASPALAVGYGVGRIGCHLAGDGDYGIPTSLPWGTNYANGTAKPHLVFRGSDIEKSFPGGYVPDDTPLHPTPVYEFLIMMLIFWVLWKFRKKEWSDGMIFMLYLVLAGIERFFIEFLRLNPRLLIGLSEAQIISLIMIVVGSFGFMFLKKKNSPKYIPARVEIRNDRKHKEHIRK